MRPSPRPAAADDRPHRLCAPDTNTKIGQIALAWTQIVALAANLLACYRHLALPAGELRGAAPKQSPRKIQVGSTT